jgi:hypothetical protein
VSTAQDDEVTDPDEYLRDNPMFARCRRRGHAWPDEDDVDLMEAYNDLEATHHMVYPCPNCGGTVRRRFVVTIRRRKVVEINELDPRGGYAKGYVAKGIRITRRYAREVAVRQKLEQSLALPPVPRRRAVAARKGGST